MSQKDMDKARVMAYQSATYGMNEFNSCHLAFAEDDF